MYMYYYGVRALRACWLCSSIRAQWPPGLSPRFKQMDASWSCSLVMFMRRPKEYFATTRPPILYIATAVCQILCSTARCRKAFRIRVCSSYSMFALTSFIACSTFERPWFVAKHAPVLSFWDIGPAFGQFLAKEAGMKWQMSCFMNSRGIPPNWMARGQEVKYLRVLGDIQRQRV